MTKNSSISILDEIDEILVKQGKSFESAVREYRAATVKEIEPNEAVAENHYVGKFKKYRSRISDDTKAKPYQELLKLRDYLNGQKTFKAAPLLHLVDDSAMDKAIQKLSKDIWDKVKDL